MEFHLAQDQRSKSRMRPSLPDTATLTIEIWQRSHLKARRLKKDSNIDRPRQGNIPNRSGDNARRTP